MTEWKLGYHANCWGALGGDPTGVTSITQLTYRTFGDMRAAFHDIRAAGFDGVELFDGNLMDQDASELCAMLDRSGLKLIAGYSGANLIYDDILEDELARLTRVADRIAEIGAPHFVVGAGARRAAGVKPDDYVRLGAGLEKVRALAEERGLMAHYHPHLSTMAETPEEVRKAFAETSIKFCPDTAHLAAAGGDPADMVREHRDRIEYVHLKGLTRDPFGFTPLDAGDLDNKTVVKALREIGFNGWVTAELDAWGDPAEGARRNMAWFNAA